MTFLLLCHYDDTIVSDLNNISTYNGKNSLLLNSNLGTSYIKIKETICHRVG